MSKSAVESQGWFTRQRREWFQLPNTLTEWIFFVGLFGTAIGAGLWVR